MDATGLTALFTGVTAAATVIVAWAVVYPYYRNARSPEIAYAYNVDLRRVNIPNSPFGVQTDQPETKRFVLRITNRRLSPLAISSIYFQAKSTPRGDRSFIHHGGGLRLEPGETRYLYLKMEPDLVPERNRVFLVIEAMGWSKRIDRVKDHEGDLRLREIPEYDEPGRG